MRASDVLLSATPCPRKRTASRPTNARTTTIYAGPIIAQHTLGRRTPSPTGTEFDTVPNNEVEGGSYERSIAEAAGDGRAGSGFPAGPSDRCGESGDGARAPRRAAGAGGIARRTTASGGRCDAIGNRAERGAASRDPKVPQVSRRRGRRGDEAQLRPGGAAPPATHQRE